MTARNFTPVTRDGWNTPLVCWHKHARQNSPSITVCFNTIYTVYYASSLHLHNTH